MLLRQSYATGCGYANGGIGTLISTDEKIGYRTLHILFMLTANFAIFINQSRLKAFLLYV